MDESSPVVRNANCSRTVSGVAQVSVVTKTDLGYEIAVYKDLNYH